MSGVWVMFSFAPKHPQPCYRYRLQGWMSTAHWNGTVFRIGETGDYVPASGSQDEDEKLAALVREIAQQALLSFSPLVEDIQRICVPRMQARKEEILQGKIDRLHRARKKQTQAKV